MRYPKRNSFFAITVLDDELIATNCVDTKDYNTNQLHRAQLAYLKHKAPKVAIKLFKDSLPSATRPIASTIKKSKAIRSQHRLTKKNSRIKFITRSLFFDSHDTMEMTHLTPLHNAVLLPRPELITELVESGCDIEAKARLVTSKSIKATKKNTTIEISQLTPLHLALRQGEIDLVNLLLSLGADANQRFEVSNLKQGITPLIWAVSKNDLEMVQILVDSGAKLSDYSNGYNALHIALLNKNIDIVNFLLKHPIDVCAPVLEGQFQSLSPLHIACYLDSLEMIKALIATRRVNINQDSIDDAKPIHFSCLTSTNPEIVQILIENGADLRAVTKKDELNAIDLAGKNSWLTELPIMPRQVF